MEYDLHIREGLSLRIADSLRGEKGYPTFRLQKGFRIVDHGQELADEAVGFGVPVLRRGLQTIFPGEVELGCAGKEGEWEVTALFTLNLEEKIARSDSKTIRPRWFYLLKNSLAELIRRFPALPRGADRLVQWISPDVWLGDHLRGLWFQHEDSDDLSS